MDKYLRRRSIRTNISCCKIGNQESIYNLDQMIAKDKQAFVIATHCSSCSHRTHNGVKHGQRVKVGGFSLKVLLPQVGCRAVDHLKLLDVPPVLSRASQHRGAEAGVQVQLCDLVGEDVAVVVVGDEPEPPLAPSDDRHARGVGQQVLKFVAREDLLEAPAVVLVEHRLHPLPEPLLPLEHRALGHHHRPHSRLQAAREEVVRQGEQLVLRVLVHHQLVLPVPQRHCVQQCGLLRLAGPEGNLHGPPPQPRGERLVLPPNSLPVEQHGLREAQPQTGHVDGVAGDDEGVPLLPEKDVGAVQPRIALWLRGCRCRRDGGFLADDAEAPPCFGTLLQHLIRGGAAVGDGEVVELPGRDVDERAHTLVQDELTDVAGHFFALNVHQRWRG